MDARAKDVVMLSTALVISLPGFISNLNRFTRRNIINDTLEDATMTMSISAPFTAALTLLGVYAGVFNRHYAALKM